MTEIPRNFDFMESKERSIGIRSGMLSKSAYRFPLCYTNISYSVCFSINTIISLFSRSNSVQYVCIALVF